MDIVIPLRRAIYNEELRYTLRSIAKNVPHDRVWLAGYRPPWVSSEIDDVEVQVPIGGKFLRTSNNLLTACKYSEVSDDFILFNDDFFVMKPVKTFHPAYRATVANRLKELSVENPYRQGLERSYDILRRMGFVDPVDYGLHIPMIMNKKKWLEMWRAQRRHNPQNLHVHLRTLYGNLNQLGGAQMADVKIADFDKEPTGTERFLSSNDDSFAQGKIGEYVRKAFPKPCKYE